jgi:hypothetical protein
VSAARAADQLGCARIAHGDPRRVDAGEGVGDPSSGSAKVTTPQPSIAGRDLVRSGQRATSASIACWHGCSGGGSPRTASLAPAEREHPACLPEQLC